MKALAALLLLLPLVILPATTCADNVTPGVAVNLTGPEKLEVSATGGYNVKIFGPADIKWGFWVNLSGPQRGGASLVSPEGTTDTSKSYVLLQSAPLAYPEFNFTLTAPAQAGPLLITVTVQAMEGTGAAGQTAISRLNIDVKAKRDVMINGTVRNSGDVAAQNVLVAFMVKLNGEWTYIGNQTVTTIEPGKKENVSIVWNSSLLDNGEYAIRIVIDPEHSVFQYSGSEGVTERTVVLRTPGEAAPKGIAPGAYVLLGVLVVAAIGGIYYYRKKKIV